MITAVYPGTFDPLTRGHEDLVRRAANLFDHVVVGVASSQNKRPFFTVEERVEIASEVLSHYPNVEVKSFSGLLKDFVREQNVKMFQYSTKLCMLLAIQSFLFLRLNSAQLSIKGRFL